MPCKSLTVSSLGLAVLAFFLNKKDLRGMVYLNLEQKVTDTNWLLIHCKRSIPKLSQINWLADLPT